MVGIGGKPLESTLTIDAGIHDAVMEERRDREKVNDAVHEGLRLGALIAPCIPGMPRKPRLGDAVC
jgi:hypothetical protein